VSTTTTSAPRRARVGVAAAPSQFAVAATPAPPINRAPLNDDEAMALACWGIDTWLEEYEPLLLAKNALIAEAAQVTLLALVRAAFEAPQWRAGEGFDPRNPDKTGRIVHRTRLDEGGQPVSHGLHFCGLVGCDCLHAKDTVLPLVNKMAALTCGAVCECKHLPIRRLLAGKPVEVWELVGEATGPRWAPKRADFHIATITLRAEATRCTIEFGKEDAARARERWGELCVEAGIIKASSGGKGQVAA
jgi:hypothetical protein